jgi:hypothetical protein
MSVLPQASRTSGFTPSPSSSAAKLRKATRRGFAASARARSGTPPSARRPVSVCTNRPGTSLTPQAAGSGAAVLAEKFG